MNIFISASNKDHIYAETIQTTATTVAQYKPLNIFNSGDLKDDEDNDISELKKRIESSEGFIFLVSNDSLESKFINKHELPLIEQKRKEGCQVKYILIDKCTTSKLGDNPDFFMTSPNNLLNKMSDKNKKNLYKSCLDEFLNRHFKNEEEASQIIEGITESQNLFIRDEFVDDVEMLREGNWETRYLPSGNKLRANLYKTPEDIKKEKINFINEQVFIAFSKRGKKNKNKNIRTALLALKKINQRGDAPPLDPDTEFSLLKNNKFKPEVNSLNGDVTPEFDDFELFPTEEEYLSVWRSSEPFTPRFNIQKFFSRDSLSEDEKNFYEFFNDRPDIQRWLYPQFPINFILNDKTKISEILENQIDNREVDFLYCPPLQEPVVIEILGSQHFKEDEDENKPETSSNFRYRSELIKYKTFGIPAKFSNNNSNKYFKEFLKYIDEKSLNSNKSVELENIVKGKWEIAALNNCIWEALDGGFLPLDNTEEWTIEVENKFDRNLNGVNSFLDLFAAVSFIWDVEITPKNVTFVNSQKKVIKKLIKEADGTYKEDKNGKYKKPLITISIETEKNNLDKLEQYSQDLVQVIARPCSVPIKLADPRPELGVWPKIVDNKDGKLESSLEIVLRYVFGKEKFRNGQLDAIINVLNRKSSLLLLPTGGGKSLIYQISALILPGRVLVIYPLNSLIEDQYAGLKDIGIDRAIAINRNTVPNNSVQELMLDSVRDGSNLIMQVTPERLLMPRFNNALSNLVSSEGLNISLVVLDEAHCISEWGQDFRVSYLGIGKRLKDLHENATGESNFPILAMTGTASRRVIKDILSEAEIDNKNNDAVVTAESYIRQELDINIHIQEPSVKYDQLKKILKRDVPGHFDMSPGEFYREELKVKNNRLGIIFVQRQGTMLDLYDKLSKDPSFASAGIGMYFGSSGPNWDKFPKALKDKYYEMPSVKAQRGQQNKLQEIYKLYKQDVYENFKKGKIRIVISTIAFGMGIDIPNIKFIIHFGISRSIEGWYQEAGRAGRGVEKGETVYIATMLSEKNKAESDALLYGVDEDGNQLNLDKLKSLSEQGGWKSKWGPAGSQPHDIRTLFALHFMTWVGIENELNGARKVLEQLKEAKGINSKYIANITIQTTGSTFGEVDQDKAVYRFKTIGALNDWQKDYRRREFHLSIPEGSDVIKFENLREWLNKRSPRGAKDYIQILKKLSNEYESGNATTGTDITNIFIEEIAKFEDLYFITNIMEMGLVEEEDPYDAILMCAITLLLQVTYQSVEFSRRSKIREVVNIVRRELDSKDIHKEFDQYFLNGPASEFLNDLADNKITDTLEWMDVWFNKIPMSDKEDTYADIIKFNDYANDFPAVSWWYSFLNVFKHEADILENNLISAFEISQNDTVDSELWEKLYKESEQRDEKISKEVKAILWKCLILQYTKGRNDLYSEEIYKFENEYLDDFANARKKEIYHESSMAILNRRLGDLVNLSKRL